MSGSTSSAVECPVCGEEFDPTAAGGWCTNFECGEWRYEEAESEDEPDATGADAPPSESESEDEDGSTESDEEPAKEAKTEETEPEPKTEAGDEQPESVEPDNADPAAPQVEDTAEQVASAAQAAAESATAAVEDDATAEITCPNCEAAVDADTNFCPSCGEDVSAVEPGDDEEELTACPSCGTDVDPEDSFCATCGEDLDAHREPEPLTACPSCGADVEPGDSFCAACGEDLDAHRGGSDGEVEAETAAAAAETGDGAGKDDGDVPESLVLRAHGEEIAVADGDTVGRELRRIVTESGGDEDDAVRIHREHVRFVRGDDGFYLVDLGQNPTRLNDTRMEEGDREPVEPGDELHLSDVISLAIHAP